MIRSTDKLIQRCCLRLSVRFTSCDLCTELMDQCLSLTDPWSVHGGLHGVVEVYMVCITVNFSKALMSWMTLRDCFELAICVIGNLNKTRSS